MNATSEISAPSTENGTVAGGRRPNAHYRTREYLTEKEIERLMAAAGKSNRHGHRDSTMILLAFRHGLRASELCSLRWEQVDLVHGRLHVARAKRRRCRAADQRDEVAARPHSITSSAATSSLSGTVRPRTLAVTWLMTSSNLVACTTGRSAGFAPFRMRPA
jgi:integrase